MANPPLSSPTLARTRLSLMGVRAALVIAVSLGVTTSMTTASGLNLHSVADDVLERLVEPLRPPNNTLRDGVRLVTDGSDSGGDGAGAERLPASKLGDEVVDREAAADCSGQGSDASSPAHDCHAHAQPLANALPPESIFPGQQPPVDPAAISAPHRPLHTLTPASTPVPRSPSETANGDGPGNGGNPHGNSPPGNGPDEPVAGSTPGQNPGPNGQPGGGGDSGSNCPGNQGNNNQPAQGGSTSGGPNGEGPNGSNGNEPGGSDGGGTGGHSSGGSNRPQSNGGGGGRSGGK